MLQVGWLNLGFVLLSVFELIYFWWVSGKNNWILSICCTWLLSQAILAYKGFYLLTDAVPPRLVFIILPVLIAVLFFGLSKQAQKFRSRFHLEKLHYIHLVRIPVEIIFLYGLFQYGFIAEEVTFKGNNWDIIPGLTMPLMALLFWKYKIINKRLLVIWNMLCFGTLVFTISQAILSAPFPFQVYSFEQPTVAVLYFPFVWLPALVAPLVLLSHLISIKELNDQP